MSTSDCMFVVDDDLSARRGLARLLRTAGHDVREFASADEFIDSLDAEARGCLLLDVGMPGMSGKELEEMLEARGINLSIIIVAADDNEETRRHAEEMKADGLFRKPVDGVALLDAIDWALRSTDKSDKHERE